MEVEVFDYGVPYKASDYAMRFMAWKDTFCGSYDNKTPMFHYALVDAMAGENDRQVVEAFRGSAKTTTISTQMPLFLAFFGSADWFPEQINYVLLISETSSQAQDLIAEILNMYNDSDELQEVMELSRSRAIELEFKIGDRYFNIVAKGSGQSMRGIKRRGQRPQIIIIDDLEDDESVMTKENRAKLKKWFFSALLPSRDPNASKIFFVGTPLHKDSLLSNLMEDSDWNGKKFPIVDKSGTPAWKDRFSLDWINREREFFKKQGMEKSFFQEYMLEVVSDDDAIFKRDDVRYYNEEDISKHIHGMNIFMSVDLAISKKESADYTVINTIAVNSDNHWFLLDQVVGRFGMSETIDKLFGELRKYKPITLVLETVAYQQAFKERVEEEMVKRNSWFRIETTSKMNKELKIQRLEPRIKARALHLPRNKDWVNELVEQMIMFRPEGAMTKHDDQLDALAMVDEYAYPPTDYSSNSIDVDIVDDAINTYLID